MGLPFSKFELRARLSRGAHLLATTDSPVAAIAEETGFVDASHFHRRFAEVYGYTPSGYRAIRRRASNHGHPRKEG
jgi:transcriptional regulator GlxA family with amidase domain